MNLVKTLSANNSRIRVFLLGLLLFLLPFELYPRVSLHGVAIRLSQVVGVLLILFCVPILYEKRREWLHSPWVPLVLFVLVSAISSIFAISKTKGIMVTSFYAFDFILAYVVAQTFDIKKSQLFQKIIYAAGLCVVVFCVWQFVGDTLGISNTFTLLNIRYTKLVFGFARVQGFSLEPLYLANYLFIPTSLALVSYVFTRKKWMAVLASLFLLIIWLTVARGAYVGMLAVLVGTAGLAIYLKKWRQLAVIILVTILSFACAFLAIRLSGNFARQLPTNTSIPTNLQTTIPQQGIDANGNTTRLIEHTTDFSSETSVQDRKQSWLTALKLATAKPLLGVGPGNFGRYVVQAYPTIFVDINQIANNETFELLAEVGVVGFALIATFCVLLLWRAARYRVKQNTEATNIWFFATAFMLVAFVIQWQTFSTLYVTHIWVIIGVYLGVVQTAHLGVIKWGKHEQVSQKTSKQLSK